MNLFFSGMMHSGKGPSQMNALLSSLNIPTVSTRTLQNRQNELGTVMEKVAEDTKRSSLHEEIQATLEYVYMQIKYWYNKYPEKKMVLFLYNASLSLLKNCIITHVHAQLFHDGSIRAEIHSV